MTCLWLVHDRRHAISRHSVLTAPSTRWPTGEVCENHHRCEQGASYNATVQAGDCFCDGLCSLYRDCCQGAESLDGGHYHVAKLVQASSCEAMNKKTVHVVNSCPEHYYDEHVLKACENYFTGDDLLLDTPVSELQIGIVFKNIFCAICHGYGIGDVRFWILKLKCDFLPFEDYPYVYQVNDSDEDSEPEIISMLVSDYADMNSTNNTVENMIGMAQRYTRISYPPDDVPSPRYCFPSYGSCPITWKDSFSWEMCTSGPQSLVYSFHTGMAYRNLYCAECNGVEINAVYCDPWSDLLPDGELMGLPGGRASKFVSISVLLDFNSQALTIRDRLVKSTRDCGNGAIYDLISGKCRILSCRIGLVLREDKCVLKSADLNMTLPKENQCPLVDISETDYYIFPNGSLVLNQTDRIYDKWSYIGTNDTVLLCVTDFIVNTLSFYGAYDLDVVQSMVSFIGQILSILALIILILIYSCFPLLRTLPGHCLLCLASSLALAQTAFVAGMSVNHFDILCKSLAIFIHFAFLVAFCWMNVMAFDIWNTFRCKFSVATTSRKKLIFYTGYCLSIPAIIVIFAVINDNFETKLSKPRYGTNFCWIGQKCALFYYFALPVFIILMCNFAFFAMSIYHIMSSSGGETVTKRRHGKGKRLILYAKLSTIMGLTWVFGYVGAVTGSSVMWYLFVICNSLQGLFICISFLCNSKIRKLLNARLEKSRSRTSVLSTTLSKTFSKQRST